MNVNKDSILVTGAAGFIGASLCNKFLNNGYKVIGLDNLNSYYDINLKLDIRCQTTEVSIALMKTKTQLILSY